MALYASHAYGQTVVLSNLTRPGQTADFYNGDTWKLEAYGGANQQVAISSVHNGGPLSGPTALGTTNGSGYFSLTGLMTTSEIGTWQEWVTVGGQSASPTLVFDVLAAPTGPCDVSISLQPLLLTSYDYYSPYTGENLYNDYASGTQSGNGDFPFCVLTTITVTETSSPYLFNVTGYSFPTPYHGQ